ncbi:glucose-6-phosphate isomerase [Ahniella affigens]|uniref:Glucose-6-phosphate isomerase n=1 Tax=Ahniella affigens TaxID=2021234 RepID=A0A2P1PR89_9GAMM|nr:glucose-6-phosphate isomerase [Ahniella affigens]AVP97345.1 glucose-6-phosphate isomerase [Ahniella affigens]
MADRQLWWEKLLSHWQRLADIRTAQLFQEHADRPGSLSAEAAGVRLDFSKHKIDQAALSELLALATDAGLCERIEALFAGELVNQSEQRPAMHMALRARIDQEALAPAFRDAATLAQATLLQCRALVEQIRGRFGADGFDVIHVGIGGSELGPKLCLEALRAPREPQTVRVHYVSNVDAHPVDHLLANLKPERTLVCLVSKSFGTQETLANGRILQAWLQQHLGVERGNQHLFAITANPRRAEAFGISADQILPMWDWVGGRYSVWSAVSLSTMLALGFERFAEFLRGAAAMDTHFRTAPLRQNVPVLMALVGIWTRNVQGLPGHCVVPYDDRLRYLPAFLQQLEMESNGKSVSPAGQALLHPTVPILWGGVGSTTQHAFFQALHQGELANVVEFVAAIKPAHAHADSHRALLANMLAQSAALMHGRITNDADPALAAQRECPGDRPSTTILLPELTPFTLGALLAAYEHKVYVQAVIWGNNAFDQWGVELGKQLADDILPVLAGQADGSHLDASTAQMIARIRETLG